MKATCKKHAKCICWVNFKDKEGESLEETRGTLREAELEWLAHATDYDAKQHLDAAREVKIAFGMKPK